jgi:uncharacterized protein involved in exopolysaccharide biosynthesis
MTPSDAALLTRAERQLYRIRKENTKINKQLALLQHALVAAQAEAELYKARADYYQEEARVLKLANSPASGGGEEL